MIDTVDALRAELPRQRARPPRAVAARPRARVRARRRRHLPRRAVARPALLRAAGARPRQLPHAGRTVSICAASGTHPGGGVTGVPGHNAAREILRDARRRGRGGCGVAAARSSTALGIAQIVSWGTLFYTIAVLGPRDARGARRRRGRRCSAASPPGSPSRGCSSPAIGRAHRRARRPRRARRAGRCWARSPCADARVRAGAGDARRRLGAGGRGDGAALYDPAFATLHQLAGRRTGAASPR